jgi:predicted TPR repeat methyltransferase
MMGRSNTEDFFKEALAEHRAGALENALKLYHKILELDPKHLPSLSALYNIASIYASQDNFPESIHLLTEILSFNPEHLKAKTQLARIYYNQSDFSNSILYFEDALKQAANDAELHHDFALTLLAHKQYTEAIAEFEKCLNLDKQHPEAHYHLATAYLKMDEFDKALNHYHQQLSIQPNLDAYYNIGVLLTTKNRNEEAVPYFEEVLELDPNYLNAHLNLGVIHLKFGRQSEAIHHYQEALRISPDDPEISYILAGISQSAEAPSNAPTQYLSHLFDQYALYYDKHLKEALKYQVPEEILKSLSNNTKITEQNQLNILDLGCGTGLSGILLKPFAKKLIGVDISENMLDLASQKNIYTELVEADISTYLEDKQGVDLIVAADVFSYHGDLETLFTRCKTALSDNGYFIFSVERGFAYPYHLQKSLRYTHSKQYLEELIEKHVFECISFDNLILRHQQQETVEGYLVLLRCTG